MTKQKNFRRIERGYDRSASKAEMQAVIEDELFGVEEEPGRGLAGLMAAPGPASGSPPPGPAADHTAPAATQRPADPRPASPPQNGAAQPADGQHRGWLGRIKRVLGL